MHLCIVHQIRVDRIINLTNKRIMKTVLKGWLANNTVTGENKGDKILVLESAGNLTLDNVLEEMKKEDTGLRKETLAHAVELYHRKLAELVLNGYSINTGLFRIVPQFRGLVEEGVWNPDTNSIYILMQQDKMLRDAIAETSVKILGEKGSAAYIIGSQDTTTRATDGSATPGRTFRVKGKNIRVTGTDEAVGVYIIASGGNKTKLGMDRVVTNNPSEVIVLLPADLEEGSYELQIVTQYSGGTKLLKTPRKVTKELFVGDAPQEPGDGGGVVDPME